MDQKELFEKFDSIQLMSLELVSSDDKAFCEKLQAEYLQARDQLQKYKAIFEEMEKSESSNSAFSLENGHVSEEWEAPWHQKLMFSPLYCLSTIEKKLTQLNKQFQDKIFTYFENTYHLDLQVIFPDNKKDSREIVDYKNIIDLIVDHLGGVSLIEKGSEEIKKSLRDKIGLSDHLSVYSKKIALQNFVYIDNFCSGFEISYSSHDSLKILIDALSFFEMGVLKPLYKISSSMPTKEVVFDSDYDLTCCSKISSVRFYKNGRVDVNFPSEKLAQQFYSTFGLSKILSRKEKYGR